VTDVDLAPGSLLCLYTDGLVERRGVGLDTGIDELTAVLRRDDPAKVTAEVMAHMVGTTVLEDDLAMLIVAVEDLDADQPLDVRVPADPTVLSELRSAVRRWTAQTPATRAEVDELLVAVGEAAANAVEHAYGPEGGTLELRLELDGAAIVATIRDHGHWRAPRGEHRGRGELLMRGLCDEVEVHQDDDGTTVVLRKALSQGEP
jgi:anti-sigma regulatory factor (Ser/Thr protein kinase)